MQDDEAAQLRCKPILHTNNVTWVATPEHGRKVVLITKKEAYCALAHYVLPPLSTHKLCTNRSFVLGDGRVSLRGWFGARGRGAQAQGSGIRTFLRTRVFRHTNCVSGQSRPWTVSTLMGLLKNGFKPGSSLSRAKAGNCTTDCNSSDNLSLFLCCFSNPTYLTTDVYYTTHTLVGCRASPPQGWEVYSTIWLSIV